MAVGDKKVSCIICAFNEAGRVGEVLKVATTYPRFDEIIAVDDGSTDGTYSEICSFSGVKAIRLDKNYGKTKATFAGVDESAGDLIFHLDADLVGLTHSNFDDLLAPHACLRCMTLAKMSNFELLANLAGMDILSGERIIPRDVFDKLRTKKFSGYSIETFINGAIISEGMPVISVKWPNVKYLTWADKLGNAKFKAIRRRIHEINMMMHIYSEVPFHKIVVQNLYMPYLGFLHRIRQRRRKVSLVAD